MTGADLVVRGGRVVSPHGTLETGLAIANGVIVAIGDPAALPPAAEVIDARGLHVLPGVIDSHVHFREPGDEHKEDWDSGTAAAACGGEGARRLRPLRLLARDNLAELPGLAAAGVIGFKCYMGETVGRALAFARWTGARLHVCHESCADVLPLIREAKSHGVDVTVETCPHYLLLAADDMRRLGPVLRMNPPVRDARHRAELWRGLADGTIDMLATDHSPHTVEEKTRADIWEAVSGFSGVETAVPLMLTEVSRGRMTLERYVEWSSANPARAWGLYPRKGALAVGSDADLVLVDLAREGTIRAAALHGKSKITPFEGVPTRGRPVATIVRGRVVMRDGDLSGEPGWGRAVRPLA